MSPRKQKERSPEPNDLLAKRRDEVDVLAKIRHQLTDIIKLIDFGISQKEIDIKHLQRRICSECGVIHPTYNDPH